MLARMSTTGRSCARYGFVWATLALVMAGSARPQQSSGSNPSPAARVDLAPLGFSRLSKAARLSGTSNVSVDFLDSQHLLVTFNPKRLFKRSPDCPPGHDDRLIHAVIIELPSARIVRETDWYLHDARRYVWPMGLGRFLLRKLNQLYQVNSDLTEKLIFDSPNDLAWVAVTPDGKQIVVEAVEQTTSNSDGTKTPSKVKISFLNADTQDVERVILSKSIINLEATSSGFTDVRGSGNVWLIRFGPGAKQRLNIARVKARRAPSVLYTSANTLLVGRCSFSDDAYSVSAFSIDGARLWRQRWSTCSYSPAVRPNEDGSRFALATMTLHPPAAGAAEGAEEDEDGLDQTIRVFDTATGNPILSLKTAPPVMGGQHLSLSPDGAYLAVLVGSLIEIHPLPGMSVEDRDKYAAIKPEIPGLAVPAQSASPQAAEAEQILISAVGDDASSAEPSSPAPAPAAASPAPPATSPQAPGLSPPPAALPVAAAATDTPEITFRTGTQVVALDVVVTDSKGHVIKGLQQNDFAVAEDGNPQRLRYFQEYASGAKPAAPAALPPPPAAPLPPNIYSNYSQPADPGATTVVLLDMLNTSIADQMRARQELIKFLKTKPPNAQFALFILGTRLQMIQGFTQDGNILLASARSKKVSTQQRTLIDSDTVVESTIEAGDATARVLPQLNFFVESFRLQQSEVRVYDADRRMFVTVSAFAQLARYLSGIPGRKNLIWLSGSFQLGIFPDASAQGPFLQARNYSDNLKHVANLLGDAHVAVYPVNVQGLVTDPLFTAASNDALAPISMQGSTPIGVTGGPGGAPVFAGGTRNANTAVPIAVMLHANEEFALTQMGERATMDQLATQTGGHAFYNTNGISQAIATAAEQGSSYYALSYTPANKLYNGAFRKVKVALPGKKLRLAYRNGYYAVNPYAPAKATKDLTSGLALAAMQQGSPPSRQVVFGARVVPLGKPRVVKDVPASANAKSKKKKVNSAPVEMQHYGIDYAVTPAELRFSQLSDGTYHDILNFMITSFDDDGNLIASQVSQMAADLKPEIFRNVMQTGIRLHQEIDVPVSGTVLRLGVEDLANSHIGTLELSLPVPVPPDAPVYSRSLPPIEPD